MVQLENTPIRAHLDFVLVGENIVRILELKSTANIPKSLSKSHEMQIQGQTALLKEYWNQPVFNLRDIHGNMLYEGMTFSEILEKYIGVEIANTVDTIDIQGWLLCVSTKEAKAYGPFIPQDWVLKLCKKNAQELWGYMQKIDASIIPHAKGFCMCQYRFLGLFVNTAQIALNLKRCATVIVRLRSGKRIFCTAIYEIMLKL